eukprot:TRINITY_DN5672_c0_g1_i1.p1 TRINITY_DN5672_c0_g1~~TRINITY_DN5672_c0_g1_i1.p1  ORF type:complete len:477 (+),score=87.84 TRINITY_DN5672_c0_g1_i1:33-1433(+)
MEDPTRPLIAPVKVERYDIKAAVIRFSVLAMICFTTFGSYYVYDMPGALFPQIKTYFKPPISDVDYGWLYSIYSWPNGVMAMCGGFLVDRVFGIRLGSVIFATIVAVGQVLFTLGIYLENYWLALAGRFVFGLGGESLAVSQSAYTAKWFFGKELELAFAITLSFSRIGSAVNLNVTPRVAQDLSFSWAAILGAIFCLFSLVDAIALAFIDRWMDRKQAAESKKEEEASPPIHPRDILKFPLPVWLIYIVVVSFYVSVFTYISYGKGIISGIWLIGDGLAGTIIGLPYTISSGASPIFGAIVNVVGRNVLWMTIATGAQTCVHALLAFIHTTIVIPWLANVIMGLAYSALAASLWPSLALLLPRRFLGTAYGIAFSLQNVGLAAAPLVVGAVLKATNNEQRYAEFIFLGCAALSCGMCVIIFLYDRRNPKLNLSGFEIRRRAKAAKEAEERTPLADEDSINSEEAI